MTRIDLEYTARSKTNLSHLPYFWGTSPALGIDCFHSPPPLSLTHTRTTYTTLKKKLETNQFHFCDHRKETNSKFKSVLVFN